MRNHIIFIIITAVLCCYTASSQEIKYNNFNNQYVIIRTQKGNISLRPFSNTIMEVTWHDDGIIVNDSSVAVTAKPVKNDFVFYDEDGYLRYQSPKMEVCISKDLQKLTFLTHNDTILIEEEGFFKTEDRNGIRFFINKDESFYGSGERAVDLDLRGNKLPLYNRASYAYQYGTTILNYQIPLLLSSKKYLIFFDNFQKGYLDIDSGNDNVLEFSTIGGIMRYYIITGNNYQSIMRQYHDLTGYQPMLPVWAFGNLMSRMAYRNQDETDSIVRMMEEEDFPIDAVILDFYWFGDSIKGHLGRLDWYEPSWPTPENMMKDLKNRGIKTVLISEPYIIDSLENHNTADSLGLFVVDNEGNTYIDSNFYFGNGSLLDIFKEETSEWLWQQYKRQLDIGSAGFWGDLGEPESHPSDIRHVNGTADEVHNIYGHYWVKGVAERFRRDFPDKRLFFLARSGAAGTQRYGIIPWSGDVSRSWSGLKAQIPLMLNMSMSGLPYIHSDAGGFALGEKDEQLYTRWLQFATFSPILRPHGSDIESEPVFFNDTTKRIVRNFMKLRYELLPYIYTTAWLNSVSGTPITAPLYFYNPEDNRFRNYSSGYYFGKDMIIFPIVDENMDSITCELPHGEWYDFFNNKIINTDNITLKCNIEHIPVFVKAGSIIPMTDYVKSTDFLSAKKLYLQTYIPNNNDSITGLIYLDDGKSFGSYENGNYELIMIKGIIKNDVMTLNIKNYGDGYDGQDKIKTLEFILHDNSLDLRKVKINNKSMKVKKTDKAMSKTELFDKDDNGLWHIKIKYDGKPTTLTIYLDKS